MSLGSQHKLQQQSSIRHYICRVQRRNPRCSRRWVVRDPPAASRVRPVVTLAMSQVVRCPQDGPRSFGGCDRTISTCVFPQPSRRQMMLLDVLPGGSSFIITTGSLEKIVMSSSVLFIIIEISDVIVIKDSLSLSSLQNNILSLLQKAVVIS